MRGLAVLPLLPVRGVRRGREKRAGVMRVLGGGRLRERLEKLEPRVMELVTIPRYSEPASTRRVTKLGFETGGVAWKSILAARICAGSWKDVWTETRHGVW
jgi:hypothetical protein